MADVERMSLEEHGQLTVTFSQAMRGTTYIKAVQTNPSWCKWVAEHMQESKLVQRRTFLLFLERFVSQAEQIEEGLQLEGSENASNRLKAAATKKKPIKERPTEDETWAMVADNESLQTSGRARQQREVHCWRPASVRCTSA